MTYGTKVGDAQLCSDGNNRANVLRGNGLGSIHVEVQEYRLTLLESEGFHAATIAKFDFWSGLSTTLQIQVCVARLGLVKYATIGCLRDGSGRNSVLNRECWGGIVGK